MIHVVCGMIGAGKTTFCYRQECDVILDLDWIDNKNKYVQLESLLKNLDKEVYYTTCYPTSLELKTFDLIDNVEFLWINTDISQCSTNILKRNRNDDLLFYKEKIKTNFLLQKFFLESDINFKLVDVFLWNEGSDLMAIDGRNKLFSWGKTFHGQSLNWQRSQFILQKR